MTFFPTLIARHSPQPAFTDRGARGASGLVVAVGTEAGVRVEEHSLFDLVVVVATVILAEATVVDRS